MLVSPFWALNRIDRLDSIEHIVIGRTAIQAGQTFPRSARGSDKGQGRPDGLVIGLPMLVGRTGNRTAHALLSTGNVGHC